MPLLLARMAYSAGWGRVNMTQRLASRSPHPLRGYVCRACARSQRRSFLTATNPAIRRKSQADANRRALHDEQKVPESHASSVSQSAIDNLILKSQFEAKRDIRDYLSKWQRQNTNDLDPVRGPDTVNPSPLPRGRWVGNMLNDTGSTIEQSLESAESVTEDSDIQLFMDEHDEVGDILEPGDLVGFYK